MAINKLTDTEVRNAKPDSKEYTKGDGGGLALKISPNGSKTWIFNYTRPLTKKRTNAGLGSFPSVSLTQARKTAETYRALLAQNIDPQTHKVAEQTRHSNTLRQVAKSWFEIKKSSVTVNYAEDIWRSFELHVFPVLGDIPISEISAPMAIEVLQAPRKRGNLETVRRVISRLNEVMTYATNTGLLDANRLAGINAAFERPIAQNNPSIPPDDLPQLMRDVFGANITLQTRLLLELSIHVIARPNEIANARWNEFSFKDQVWNIPSDRMKKRRDFAIPLSGPVLAILEKLRGLAGHSEFVFPSSRTTSGAVNPQTANNALKKMGYEGLLTAHGIRSIGATAMYEHGYTSDLVEPALSHTSGDQTRNAYDRSKLIELRRPMMEWWSHYVEDAKLSGLVSKRGGNSVGNS